MGPEAPGPDQESNYQPRHAIPENKPPSPFPDHQQHPSVEPGYEPNGYVMKERPADDPAKKVEDAVDEAERSGKWAAWKEGKTFRPAHSTDPAAESESDDESNERLASPDDHQQAA